MKQMKSLVMMMKKEASGYVSVRKTAMFAAYTSILGLILGIVYAGMLTT